MRATSLEVYGFPNPSQSKEVKRRTIESNLINWGVPHPHQSERFWEKNPHVGYAHKPVVIHGRTYMVQGYEDSVLKSLEDSIVRLAVSKHKMPKLMYTDPHDVSTKRYFPDALVETPDGGTVLLEVKSVYTLLSRNVLEKAKVAFDFCSQFDDLRHLIALYDPKLDSLVWMASMEELKSVRSIFKAAKAARKAIRKAQKSSSTEPSPLRKSTLSAMKPSVTLTA